MSIITYELFFLMGEKRPGDLPLSKYTTGNKILTDFRL
jgi:hypothetical protein